MLLDSRSLHFYLYCLHLCRRTGYKLMAHYPIQSLRIQVNFEKVFSVRFWLGCGLLNLFWCSWFKLIFVYFRFMGTLFEQFPGHSQILRCQIQWMYVGFRRGILHFARLHFANFLRHSAIFLHFIIHTASVGIINDGTVFGVFPRQRKVHSFAFDKWHNSSSVWNIGPAFSNHIRLLWRLEGLDA